MSTKQMTKRQREFLLDELVALQEALPDWKPGEIVHSACGSGDIPLRLAKPRLEEFGYTDAQYPLDRESKRRLKRTLDRTPWGLGTAIAIVGGVTSVLMDYAEPSPIIIVIAGFVSGALIGSFYRRLRWQTANRTIFSKLNRYDSALFAYVYWSRRRKTEFWKSLSGPAFEHELANLFRLEGYRATVTRASGDKGVDIELMKNDRKGIVQCKAHKALIGPNIVRELYGTAAHFNSDFAVLASISGFTQGAILFAAEKSIRLIALEDILRLQDSIARKSIGGSGDSGELGTSFSNERILNFPKNEVFGTIYLRDRSIPEGPLVLFGTACGRVGAPKQSIIHLQVGNPDSGGVNSFPDLAALRDLQPGDIQEIDLLAVELEDDDLLHLIGLRGLQWLRLKGTLLTDAAFLYLSELTSLRTLIIEFGQLSGLGLIHLEALERIEELQLNGITGFTDAGLRCVTRLQSLKRLSVFFSDVSVASLARLQQLPSLEWLNVGASFEINEASIPELAKLTGLRTIEISTDQVEDDTLTELRARLPNCQIVVR